MSELLERSARLIDDGVVEGPRVTNPMNTQVSELSDDLAMIDAFSHVVILRTDEGHVLFDVSLAPFGPVIVDRLREWDDRAVHSVVYTHGHVDHVGGMGAIKAAAEERGRPRIQVVGHDNVDPRFDRYDLTAGYNAAINARQFGGSGLAADGSDAATLNWPRRWVRPDVTYAERMELRVGDNRIRLHHDRGETDDHTWAWLPDQKAVCVGDFLCWVFPNAGNPQKVQRYPGEWARALRSIAALEPELLLPAHGLPIAGRERIGLVLDNIATALESLLDQTLEMMNDGCRLDEIIHSVAVPDHLMDLPYLQPVYDEPEFVVNNIWRLYGGWYDGNPAHLKPPADQALSEVLAELAGGAGELAKRALEASEAEDHRLASQLAEFAGAAAPTDASVHEIRAQVYRDRRRAERSLMAKGIFGDAARQSRAVVDGPG